MTPTPPPPPAAARPALCAIRGVGRYVPEQQLTNADLEKLVDTTDEWITQRTGIKSRRVIPDDWVTSDMAVAAGRAALADAGLAVSDVDLLVVTTVTPDMLCPSTACIVHKKLGLVNVPAFDISVACSGFGYGVSIAGAMVNSGLHRNALVISSEAMTRFMDYTDRASCILFGDGAGAAVLSREGRFELLYTENGADGSLAEMIEIPAGGSREPANEATVAGRRHFLQVRGREVFKTAVRQMVESTHNALRALGLTTADIDWVVPHQANSRIIEAVAQSLEVDPARVVIDITDKGNTSSASIPIALAGLAAEQDLKPGQILVLVGFGAGAAWSCQVLRVRA
ncbi:MAG: beta-ketoacyl-ACP synthase III [Planctomycetota bacterium]